MASCLRLVTNVDLNERIFTFTLVSPNTPFVFAHSIELTMSS